jgi:hypothetical protein
MKIIITESQYRLILEKKEDLTFKFDSEKVKKTKGVLFHEIITIEPFDIPDGHKKNLVTSSFHLIIGKNSLAIFDVFNTDEIAGLKREDCENKLKELSQKNQTEKYDAFIAGLTNIFDGEVFLFINNERMKEENQPLRVIPHECLHLTRLLLTLNENKKVNLKNKNWWKKIKFTQLNDENEETFSEILERCTTIVFNKFNKL